MAVAIVANIQGALRAFSTMVSVVHTVVDSNAMQKDATKLCGLKVFALYIRRAYCRNVDYM